MLSLVIGTLRKRFHGYQLSDPGKVLCYSVFAVSEQGDQRCVLQLQPIKQCLQAQVDCSASSLIALPECRRWGDFSQECINSRNYHELVHRECSREWRGNLPGDV